VDYEQALIVEFYDEPPMGDQFGVVVDSANRVLSYRARTDDWSWSWDDLSDDWDKSQFADQIRVGIAMIDALREHS